MHLKLLNPLGVAAALASRHAAVVQERLALLADDFATLDDVERQLGLYQQDLTRDLELRMADIDRILLQMEQRGHEYFDETMRIGRVMDLLNRSRVQEGFERQVVADAPQQIEKKIGELVDWLVEMDLRQWQAVTSHLAERRRQYRERIVGDDAGRFHYDRTRLIDAVGGDAQRVVDSYDRRREAQELADGARNAVAAAAAASAPARSASARWSWRSPPPPRPTHRPDHGVAPGHARVLHHSGEAQAGEGGDAAQDRGGARAAVDVAPRAVRAGSGDERRPDPGRHRTLQPVRARRRGQPEGCSEGAGGRDRSPRGSAVAHRTGYCSFSGVFHRYTDSPIDVHRLERRVLRTHVEALGDDRACPA